MHLCFHSGIINFFVQSLFITTGQIQICERDVFKWLEIIVSYIFMNDKAKKIKIKHTKTKRKTPQNRIFRRKQKTI